MEGYARYREWKRGKEGERRGKKGKEETRKWMIVVVLSLIFTSSLFQLGIEGGGGVEIVTEGLVG